MAGYLTFIMKTINQQIEAQQNPSKKQEDKPNQAHGTEK